MDTCFLFVKHLDEKGCSSLKLSSDGELIAPLQHRSFAELHDLQKETKTIIVESCAHATLIDLELPWLAERKARVAIPYALEDKLAQSVEQLHFCFDKFRYQNNHYLVTVISKTRMQFLMQTLAEQHIEYAFITLDWFALAPQELCVSEATLLVNNDDFKGALSGELALSYLSKHILNPALTFQDSQIITDLTAPSKEEHSFLWIARNLLKTKPFNLCQGEMRHEQTKDWLEKGYQIAGILCAVWISSVLLINALTLYSLNKQTAVVDAEIATVYKDFFPDAKQVISPKFRIKQLLQSDTSDSQGHFWYIMNQLAQAFSKNKVTIEQLRYQNKTVSVTLASADFASLETFENQLKQLKLNVKRTQASTRDQQVVATLELS
ncbi:MAG: general secretion pathway protein GspL [Legionella sp.]|nr:MAG: general secretion pathway protein GspL [Legionella sp.]